MTKPKQSKKENKLPEAEIESRQQSLIEKINRGGK